MVRKILSILFILSIFSTFSQAIEKTSITTSEYLDSARDALKTAYESGANIKAPYEYGKAEGFYKIAVEKASNFNLEEAVDAAKKSVEWSLKALEKSKKGE